MYTCIQKESYYEESLTWLLKLRSPKMGASKLSW